MANLYNTKLVDVLAAFKGVKEQGLLHSCTGEPHIGDLVESHVQGFVPYKDYYVGTHNNHGQSKGRILVVAKSDNQLSQWFATHHGGHNHPDGIQTIGDYAIVGVDKDVSTGAHDGFISFYDLTTMSRKEPPTLLALDIHVGGELECVGITNYTVTVGGVPTEYYIFGIYGDKKFTFYRSNGKPLNDAGIAFTRYAAAGRPGTTGFDGLGLLTDVNNDIYMIGLFCKGTVSLSDYAYLWRVDFTETDSGAEADLTQIATQHFTTHHGGVSGEAGVHFRWGSGVHIVSETSIALYATQRNFVGNHWAFNSFDPQEASAPTPGT